MINESGPRRRHDTHDVMDCADNQRRYAAAFDHMGDETDRLMAEGSVGNEQSKIDLGLLKVFGNGGRQLVFNLRVIAQAAHKRKVKRR